MDTIAAALGWSMLAMLFWQWGIMALSGLFAGALIQRPWKLGRAAYFASLNLIFFLWGATSFLGTLMPHAAANGYAFAVVAVFFAAIVVLGAITGICAASRSLDVFGTRNRWLYAFIPYLNLQLLLPPSSYHPNPDRVGPIKAAGLFTLGLTLCVGGPLIIPSMYKPFLQAMDELPHQSPEEAMRMQFETFKPHIIKNFAGRLPLPIDDNRTLIDVKVIGRTLIRTIKIHGDAEADTDLLTAYETNDACNSPEVEEVFDWTGIAETRYLDKNDQPIVNVTLTRSSCEVWNKNRVEATAAKADRKSLERRITAAQTTGRSLAHRQAMQIVSDMSLKPPMNMEPGLTLTAVKAESDAVLLVISATGNKGKPEETKLREIYTRCTDPAIRREFFDRGVSILSRYHNRDDNTVLDVRINTAQCQTLDEQIDAYIAGLAKVNFLEGVEYTYHPPRYTNKNYILYLFMSGPISAGFDADAKKRMCSAPHFQTALRLGVTIWAIIIRNSDEPSKQLYVDRATCGV
ncbi:hypothetical protein [Rhizobium sp. RM]|uniref:hypothetical protein n=1 Tax=Rhizobium sp. RM TaxID=2748079 RepID=UPI00110F1A05|nr:hypothetical protein [Rhizobium sp. RM]NWJ26110.1 hypothetical protein [Rhizobium sp. RM]TMV20705.1 hypothetical protein BJG94_08395 [Rhizobium sp. Td3]